MNTIGTIIIDDSQWPERDNDPNVDGYGDQEPVEKIMFPWSVGAEEFKYDDAELTPTVGFEMLSDINGPIESEETAGIITTYVVHFYGNTAIFTITYDYQDGYDPIVEYKEYTLEQLMNEVDMLNDYEMV